MALDPSAIGASGDPMPIEWTVKDTLLYAISVGAGARDLSYSTDNTRGVPQQVIPTYPVIMVHRASSQVMKLLGEFNPARIVHGQQSVTLCRPIPPAGEAVVTATVSDMFDKGNAAVVILTASVVMDDGPLCTTRMSMFIRDAGGWGGDRGPSASGSGTPERAADYTATYQTSPDQAFIYRLNGDRNPLHTDPAFARLGGFDTPILHGLCSYGFTGRGLVHMLCDGDTGGVRHIGARFASPVIPGENLAISAWRTAPGEAAFSTSVDDRVVLDQGILKYEVSDR